MHKDEILIGLGDDPRDYPTPPGEPPHQETLVALKIEPEDLKRLLNYFSGEPWPYTHSVAEIEAAGEWWLEMQDEIRRGK